MDIRELEERLPRYRELREAMPRLNSGALVKTLSQQELIAGARDLGMLGEGNTLVFRKDDENSVLMDHCLFDFYVNGMNRVRQYLKESPPPAGSPERVLLEAMAEARYTILKVRDAVKGVGVSCQDGFTKEKVFLFDIHFSASAIPGRVLATRVIAPEGMLMACGAALPIPDRALLRKVEKWVFGFARRERIRSLGRMTSRKNSQLATGCIRLCLKHGASSHIGYQTLEQADAPPDRIGEGEADETDRSEPDTIARNAPCPCGSGKLYKKCHGR